jgi:hypothetical protein
MPAHSFTFCSSLSICFRQGLRDKERTAPIASSNGNTTGENFENAKELSGTAAIVMEL